MPRPFNDTNYTTLVDLFEQSNAVTSPTGYHYFGDLMVACVWIVLWGVYANYYTERPQMKALIVSSFGAFFFAAMLNLIGLVDPGMVALPFAGLILGVIADKIQEGI